MSRFKIPVTRYIEINDYQSINQYAVVSDLYLVLIIMREECSWLHVIIELI